MSKEFDNKGFEIDEDGASFCCGDSDFTIDDLGNCYTDYPVDENGKFGDGFKLSVDDLKGLQKFIGDVLDRRNL